MKNRKTYGRWDIGRLEIEAGWFPGEDVGLSASILTFRRGHISFLYLQVAKFCFSLGVDTEPTPEAVAEWGKGFEALAHRGPAPAAPELPPPPEEDPEPTEEEIRAARIIIKQNGSCRKPISISCQTCRICAVDGGLSYDSHEAAARAWLEERGIPIEEPASPEAAE